MIFSPDDGGSTIVVSNGGSGDATDLQGYVNNISITKIEFVAGTYDFDIGIEIGRDDLEFRGVTGQNVILNYTGTTAGSTLKVESSAPFLCQITRSTRPQRRVLRRSGSHTMPLRR